jgi:hypothetical protein
MLPDPDVSIRPKGATMRIATLIGLLILLAPAGAAPCTAQDEEKKKIEELEKQIEELNKRVKILEEQVGGLKNRPAPAPSTADPGAGAISANEHAAIASLKALVSAENDFKKNDRDGNGLHDFWVGDLSGLYRFMHTNKEIKLIDKSLADADAAPLKMASLAPLKIDKPVPRSGYLFTVLAKYGDNDKTEPYHSGGFRNEHKFGFAAYPAEYGKSGRATFVVGESGTVWKKDLGGKPPEAFLESPWRENWDRLE